MFEHRRAARIDAYGTVNATTRELRDASLSSARGDHYMTSASAEAVGSWIKRLCHHHMVPCELWDAQSSARPPHRRVWSLRYALGENARPTLRLLWRALATIALHDHIIG